MHQFKRDLSITLSVVLIWYIDNITGTCLGQVYKKTMFEGKLYEGWASSITVGSIRECGENCTIDTECQSFGINRASLNCYLYNFLIWSGSRGTTDLNMVYYWAYQGEYAFILTHQCCFSGHPNNQWKFTCLCFLI
ncbi:hypothetical protein SNE40_015429 [Patella caerulea]|uniref:Apple domain-containing protein n=1 Tax=Patella caerulea TaxID=87958 RepID=A0AAN8JHC1_PATCE